MNIDLHEWKIEDAPDLAAAINNKKVLDNLRDLAGSVIDF